MVKNVIFDLGRVLIDWNPSAYLNKHVKDQEKIKILFREIFGSQEWLDLDRGTISEEEAIKRYKERCPTCHKEIDEMFENIIELIPPLEKNIGLFEEVASKYNTYILSNFGERTFSLVFEKYPWFKLFDGKIVLAEINEVVVSRKSTVMSSILSFTVLSFLALTVIFAVIEILFSSQSCTEMFP